MLFGIRNFGIVITLKVFEHINEIILCGILYILDFDQFVIFFVKIRCLYFDRCL